MEVEINIRKESKRIDGESKERKRDKDVIRRIMGETQSVSESLSDRRNL